MNATVRLPRALLAEVMQDLERPHAFAAERFGFMHARWTLAGDDLLVLPYAYAPVADEHYIVDHTVGAKINGTAIRSALQATLDANAACLHVHVHPPLMTHFSRLDLAEQDKLIPSFVAAVPTAPHGALVIHGQGGTARLWVPGRQHPILTNRIVTVGFPMHISWSHS